MYNVMCSNYVKIIKKKTPRVINNIISTFSCMSKIVFTFEIYILTRFRRNGVDQTRDRENSEPDVTLINDVFFIYFIYIKSTRNSMYPATEYILKITVLLIW